ILIRVPMIAIYKRLPKTNCGKCGAATCMAFALKVKNAQALLSDCPYVVETGAELIKPDRSPFSNFGQVADTLEKEAVALDFKKTAEAIGGRFETADGQESVVIRMMTRDYVLQKDGLRENSLPCRDVWAKIIICDYLRRRGNRPLTGELITLGHFPHTASHVKAFQSNAEKKICDRFGKDLPGLKQRCSELGGMETSGMVKADFSCRFDLLPHVQLYLSFWQADEEFAADCKLLFDSSASDHIDIEYLAYLVERSVEEIAGV
ncbi:MAG TPA: DUF3786 domain-containing protein, partial [Thermodesulfovibrionales bacterium]|nr:DUF3786 domain-containing protein [Thermodesulfovibrionales bacterium]